MQSHRRTSLWTRQSPAITPEPPERKTVGRLTLEEAHAEVFNLKRLLASERRRHAQTESILAKYQSILEKTITDQREAFETLGAELLPHERDKR